MAIYIGVITVRSEWEPTVGRCVVISTNPALLILLYFYSKRTNYHPVLELESTLPTFPHSYDLGSYRLGRFPCFTPFVMESQCRERVMARIVPTGYWLFHW